MQAIETLSVKLALDAADFASGIQKTESKMAAFGQKMTSIGKGLTLGITAPIVGMAAASINAAGDLEESINKVSVVFDENAATVLAWSEDAAQALGQSQEQALEAAGTFGNLFDSMGLSAGATTEMSLGLVELASDLASFNNIDPTIALEKLRAGIVGEVEPLRTLGVNLSAVAVEAKAMEMGLAATGKELTESDKVTARYALILEQTANAQGDFANTSDGLANATRIVKAQFTDAAAALGQNLLPVATDVVAILNNLLERFNKLDPSTQAWIVKIALLAAAIGPVLVGIGSMITAVTSITAAFAASGPVIAAITAAITALTGPIAIVIAAVAGLAIAWQQNWFGIRDITAQAWEGIKHIVTGTWDAIQGIVTNIIDRIKSTFQIDWGALGRGIVQGIISGIDSMWNSLVDKVRQMASMMVGTAQDELEQHSPSKKGVAIGTNFGESIGMGIRSAMGDISLDVTAGLRGAISDIEPRYAAVGGGARSAPAITLNVSFSGNVDRAAVTAGTRDGVLAGLRQVGLA